MTQLVLEVKLFSATLHRGVVC